MQATLPLPVVRAKQAYDALSEQDKLLFEEVIKEDDGTPIPEAHLELLEARERSHEAGENPSIPVDEAFKWLREKMNRRRQTAVK